MFYPARRPCVVVATIAVAVAVAVAVAAVAAALGLPPAHALGSEPGAFAFEYALNGVTPIFGPDGIMAVRGCCGMNVLHPNGTLAFTFGGVNSTFGSSSGPPHPQQPPGTFRSPIDTVSFGPGGIMGTYKDYGIHIFHPNGTFDFRYTAYGATSDMFSPGLFHKRYGPLAFGPGGIIAVSDLYRVQVFHPNGTFAFQFGSNGSGLGEFYHRPGKVAFSPDGFMFVPDGGNYRVQVFHPNGTLAFVVGDDRDTAYFERLFRDGPRTVAFGPDGIFAVSAGSAVFVFHSNATLAFKYGGVWVGWNPNPPPGTFHNAGYIHFRPCGVLVVYDPFFDRAQVFHPPPPAPLLSGPPVEGATLSLGPAGYFSVDYEYEVDSVRRCALASELGSYGLAPIDLMGPFDIATDDRHHVIAMYDRANRRIQVFHYDGAFACGFGLHGQGPGGFAGPVDLNFGDLGFLYVHDRGAHRAHVFDVIPCVLPPPA